MVFSRWANVDATSRHRSSERGGRGARRNPGRFSNGGLGLTAVYERCAMCGGVLGAARVIVSGEVFHSRCSHDARDQRIAELEAAIRSMFGVIPGGSLVDPQVLADEMRAIAEGVGVKVSD